MGDKVYGEGGAMSWWPLKMRLVHKPWKRKLNPLVFDLSGLHCSEDVPSTFKKGNLRIYRLFGQVF